MIHGRFLHQAHVIGKSSVLDIYADCSRMIDSLGLDPSGHIPAMAGTMELFLLGKTYPRSVLISQPAVDCSGGPVTDGRLRFMEWYGKGNAVHDTDRNRAVLLVPGSRHYHRGFLALGMIRPLVDRMLVAGGYIPLHAAAAAGRHAMIITGKPGSGKTTLLMALLERGMNFLGDDRAAVTCHTRGMATVHRFPERIRIAGNIGPKRSITPESSCEVEKELRLIVFLEPDDGPVRIEAISPSESAARFLAMVPPSVDQKEWCVMGDTAGSIASAVPMRVLRGWGGMFRRMSMIDRLMEDGGIR